LTEPYAMIDGASSGNPGLAGIGGFIIKECSLADLWSIKIGVTTNNVAEYRALMECLLRAKKLGIRKLKIYTDSELLKKQIKGEYQIKEKKLKLWYSKIMKLKKYVDFEISLVKREKNKIADRLAKLAIKK